MIKDKIRKLVRNILPYKFIITKKRNGFWDDALKGTENPKMDAVCMFASVVSVEGFGATGSSAVIDLIREYKDMAVLGTVDPDITQRGTCRDRHPASYGWIIPDGTLF